MEQSGLSRHNAKSPLSPLGNFKAVSIRQWTLRANSIKRFGATAFNAP
jgi:hypothetical protein